jgi:hypothetical protein
MPEKPNQLLDPELQSHDDESSDNGVGISSQPLLVSHQPQQPPYSGQQPTSQSQWGQQPPQQWQQPMPPQQEWQSQSQMYSPPQYQQSPQYPPHPYQEYAAPQQPYYGQLYYGPPVLPPKKRWAGKRILLWIGVIFAILFVGSAAFAGMVAGIRGGTSNTPTPVTTTAPAPVQTQPQPTVSAEDNYKQSATTVTIAQLVASGDQYKGRVINITGTVQYSFVTDKGTSGMSILGPDATGKSIVAAFPDGTNMDGFQAGDSIHLWGLCVGTIMSGSETFSGMGAVYWTDTTSGITN